MAEFNHCIRCGTKFEKGQQYCTNCGAPVVNRCTDSGDLLRDPCGKACGMGDLFCPKCGSQTMFHKAGLLSSPYKENKVYATDELSEMETFNHQFFAD